MNHVRPIVRSERTARTGALREIESLFRRLNEAGIEYAHWKSNEHLSLSLRGESDLDILVAQRDVQRFTALLATTSFRRCLTPPARKYPAIESYIGFDDESGRLIHLHTHYQLTVGERHLKAYRVPWEHVLLSRRVFSENDGLYVTDPQLELLLLVLRSAFKLNPRHRLLGAFGRPAIQRGSLREFDWLATRVDRPGLAELARALVGEPAAALLEAMLEEPPMTPRMLARFRGAITPRSEEYQTYRRSWAHVLRLAHEVVLLRAPRLRLPQGGTVIAVLGPDGAGKSSLTGELTRWLSSRFDVARFYFGSGQGSISLVRRALRGLARLLKPATSSARPSGTASRRWSGESALRSAGRLLWIATLSRERRRRAARARQLRNRGSIVLCDRFPQSQAAVSDGPALTRWLDDPSGVRRAAARAELAAIQYVERLRPALVLKLRVTREIALLRKPETSPIRLDAKIRVLERLRFAPETRVVEIDATQPFEQVLLEAKRAIWVNLG